MEERPLLGLASLNLEEEVAEAPEAAARAGDQSCQRNVFSGSMAEQRANN